MLEIIVSLQSHPEVFVVVLFALKLAIILALSTMRSEPILQNVLYADDPLSKVDHFY